MKHSSRDTCSVQKLSDTDRQIAPWWSVFRSLRDARTSYGLKAGHLTTLAALLSFLREGDGQMIVFASNESILERLNGLCERTFQRHVSQLIEAGLLRRNDSSNRKRFKLRGPTNKALAFGFDLSPLIEKAPEISAFALEESKRASHAAMLRQQILSLLAASDHLSIDPAKDAQLRQVLRRKLPIDMLEHMLSTLEVAADARSRCNGTITANSEEADKMSANDQQNVGHIHKSKEEDIEIDRTELKIRAKI